MKKAFLPVSSTGSTFLTCLDSHKPYSVFLCCTRTVLAHCRTSHLTTLFTLFQLWIIIQTALQNLGAFLGLFCQVWPKYPYRDPFCLVQILILPVVTHSMHIVSHSVSHWHPLHSTSALLTKFPSCTNALLTLYKLLTSPCEAVGQLKIFFLTHWGHFSVMFSSLCVGFSFWVAWCSSRACFMH